MKFVHPEFERDARADLALLAVDERYWRLEPLPNTTSVQHLLSE